MTNSPENTGDFERNRRSSAKRRSRAALDGRGGSLDRAIDVFGSTRAAGENPWELRALLRTFKTALGKVAARALGPAQVASTCSPRFAAPWLKLVTALTFVAWRMLRVLRTHQRWERRAVCYRLEEAARWRAAHGPLTPAYWARLGFNLQIILTDTLRLRPSLHRLEGRFWRLWVIFKAAFADPSAPCRKPPPPGLERAQAPAGARRLLALAREVPTDPPDILSQPAAPPSVKLRRREPKPPGPPLKPRAPRPKRPPRSLHELARRLGPRWFHWPPTDWLASLARRGQIHEPANLAEFEQMCLRALGPDPKPRTQAEVRSAENPALRAPLGNVPAGHFEEPGGDEESRPGTASGVASEEPRNDAAGDSGHPAPRARNKEGSSAGPRNDRAGSAPPSPGEKAADRKARSARPRRPKSAPSAAVQSPDHPSPDEPMIPSSETWSEPSCVASGKPRNDRVGTAAPSPGEKAADRKARSALPRRPKSARKIEAVQSPDRPSPDHPMIPSPETWSEPSCVASGKPRNDRVGSAPPSPGEKTADRKTRSALPRRPKSARKIEAVQSPDRPSPDHPMIPPDRPITGSPDASAEPSPLVVAFADALYARLWCLECRRGGLLEMLHAALEPTSAPAGDEGKAADRKTRSARPRRPSSAPSVAAQSPDHPSPDHPMGESPEDSVPPAREQIEESLGAWFEQCQATLKQAAINARRVQVLFYDLAAARCGVNLELLVACRPPLTYAEADERRGRPEWDSEPVLPDGAKYTYLDFEQTWYLDPNVAPPMPFPNSDFADSWYYERYPDLNRDDPDEADEEAEDPLSAYREFARKQRVF